MLKEGQIRIPSGCAIAAIIDRKGGRINGSEIIKSIALMHDRSNGLGGGFAAYGIYPDHAEDYAFHVFYDKPEAKVECEDYLFKHFNVDVSEKIPTKKIEAIANGPDIWRYFVPSRYDGSPDRAEGVPQWLCRSIDAVGVRQLAEPLF